MKQRLERALEVAMRAISAINEAHHTGFENIAVCKTALAEIDAILHPVEVEEVTIIQYTVITPNGGCLGTYPTQEEAARVMHDSFQLVELKGTIRCEKKAVERSVTVEARIANDGIVYSLAGGPVVFHEHKEEVNGKTGKLTFEWTE